VVSPEPLLSGAQNVTDWGRLERADVAGVARPRGEAELQALVRHAAERELKLSLRGSAHSSGGHSFSEGGVMVDLRGFDRVLDVDPDARTVRVQSGATWAQLTQRLEPLRLALPTKQEFDCFTVGGSLAANAHGKSVDQGPLIAAVRVLRLLKADASIVTLSREQDPELFRAVVGGYGLLGIVLDVEFELVEDRPVEKTEVVRMQTPQLVESYIERIRRDPAGTPLCYGFFNADCSEGFYLTYTYTDEPSGGLDALERHAPHPRVFDALVGLQRRFGFVRRRAFDIFWIGSQGPELTLRSRRLLLWDDPPAALQGMLLQKYLVSVDRFGAFARAAGAIFAAHSDSVQSLPPHFRFVPGGDEAMLPLANEDSICLIPSWLARPGDPRWRARFEAVSHELIEACLDHGGNHFLTFDSLASREQLLRAYPRWDEFVALKRRHDPAELFSSRFYEKYAQA